MDGLQPDGNRWSRDMFTVLAIYSHKFSALVYDFVFFLFFLKKRYSESHPQILTAVDAPVSCDSSGCRCVDTCLDICMEVLKPLPGSLSASFIEAGFWLLVEPEAYQ